MSGNISNLPKYDGIEIDSGSLVISHEGGGGSYTPVAKSGLNSTITLIDKHNFNRVEDIVTVFGSIEGTITTGGAGNPLTAGISIPFGAAFAAINEASGLVHLRSLLVDASYPGNAEAIVSETNVLFRVYGHGLASSDPFEIIYSFSYTVK